MAITPRTIFTQPAPAAVLGVALFGLTVLGTHLWDVDRHVVPAPTDAPCADLAQEQGDQRSWGAAQWARYATCLDHAGRWSEARRAAARGQLHYPSSEALINIEAYAYLRMDRPGEAVAVLDAGLDRVGSPTNAIMENNLAWALLWDTNPDLERARHLYRRALDREPQLCEALHTGLTVEFGIATSTDGMQRAEALKEYTSLRHRYQACENRDREWSTTVETAGTAVMDSQIETWLAPTQRSNETLRTVATTIRSTYGPRVTGVLCYEAFPLVDVRAHCREVLSQELRAIPAPVRLADAPRDYEIRNTGWLRHHWGWFKEAQRRGDRRSMNEAVQSVRFWVPDASPETARCRR